MKALKGIFMIGLLAACVAACHQEPASQPAAASPSNQAVKEPAVPAAAANDNVWGEYLAAKAKIHAKEIEQRPYSYIIPAGDTPAVQARRKDEAESVTQSVGHILIPGSLLILGGPDAHETNLFAGQLPKDIKQGAMAGVTILIVGDLSQKDALTKAFEPTGASLRFASM